MLQVDTSSLSRGGLVVLLACFITTPLRLAGFSIGVGHPLGRYSVSSSLGLVESAASIESQRRPLTMRLRATISADPIASSYPTIAFNPEGRLLATGSRRGPARLWNTDTGSLMITLGKAKSRGPLVFSPDGQILATSDDKTVRLWDSNTGQLKATLIGSSGLLGFVRDISFSPNGKTLLTLGSDSKVRLWDVLSSQLRATFSGREINQAILSPDGRILATADLHDSMVMIWDVQTGITKKTLPKSSDPLVFTQDGRTLAAARYERGASVALWDTSTWAMSGALVTNHYVHQIVVSPDGKTLLTAGGRNHYSGQIWDLATRQLRIRLELRGSPSFGDEGAKNFDNLRFSPNGRMFMAANNKSVKLLDATSGDLLATLKNARYPAVFSPDGHTLATAGKQDTVILWDISLV